MAPFPPGRFQQQLEIWESEYLNKPYEMVANGYRRPPIKNVYMMYGVNWPTPVSERYSVRAGHPEPQIAEQRVEAAGGIIRDKKTWRVVGENVWASKAPHASFWHNNFLYIFPIFSTKYGPYLVYGRGYQCMEGPQGGGELG